jgi:hypothetical protein
MKILMAFLLITLATTGRGFAQQIPGEWQSAAQLVISELERDTPLASKPWTGVELTQGWQLARAWRKHNNNNVEIILAEYLTFVALCRHGCAGNTIDGKSYVAVAEQVKAMRAQSGPYGLASSVHAWLAGVPDPTGAAAKNAAMWNLDLDVAAADFATGNLYALYWLLAQAQPTPLEQANTFTRFAIFVQGRAWIGTRCLDISKVAAVVGAPPRIETCK